ncbi:MAG: M6 family metalloprotease domain-containing protein [Elusimicrobia bacterium]|nr:M6 family metalloprotease domain-containing protein [Elusimicrobiota bacterium]
MALGKLKLLGWITNLLLLFSHPLWGMPPHADVLDKILNKVIEAPPHLKMSSEEWAALGIDQPDINPVSAALQNKDARSTVSFRLLAILVHFTDNPSTVTATSFNTLIFSTASGSVNHFYRENSYGQLDVVTLNLPSSLGWKMAPSSYSYYVNGQYGFGSYPRNAQKLGQDLVALVNPFVNFANYDNDGNGTVDTITIIHSGPGAEVTGNPNHIWSHKWSFPSVTVDGVTASSYNIEPEYVINPGDMTIGVIAHELGHALGLPDLYDTDLSSYGIGKWDVMSYGSWNGPYPGGSSPAHFSAWCKIQLGFVAPQIITGSQIGVQIPNAEQFNTGIFRLWTNGVGGSQYFLVENRQKIGYDLSLPGSGGLLIWHIDDAKPGNTQEWYPPNDPTLGHYKVALVQADNLWEMEKKIDQGDTSDPFPGLSGNRYLTAITSPTSRSYASGQPDSLVRVQNISNSSNTMTADFAVLASSDVLPPSVIITNPTNGSTVSGTISVSANASDNIGVAGVQFKLDGVNLGSEDTTAPYSTSWNTTSASEGTHTLTAVARDGSLNSTTSSPISITVRNDTTPPTPPGNLSTQVIFPEPGTIHLSWSQASDAQSGIGGYKVTVTSGPSHAQVSNWTAKNLGVVTSTTIAGLNRDTTHYIEVIAYDNAGNQSDNSACVGIRTRLRGDLNNDGTSSTILDLTFLVNRIFRGGPAVDPLYIGDLNNDGTSSTILDLTFLVNRIFRGGPPPAPIDGFACGTEGTYGGEGTPLLLTNTATISGPSTTPSETSVSFFGSTDIQDPNPIYVWHFGDGGVYFVQNPTHTFSNSGTYTVSLYVGDMNNNLALAQYVVTVAETTPPTVAITSPTAGSTVSGTVTISANASDNVVVARIQFKVDGSILMEDTTSPYIYSWNTVSLPNGEHSLTALAYDAAGNSAQHSISVTVRNSSGGCAAVWPYLCTGTPAINTKEITLVNISSLEAQSERVLLTPNGDGIREAVGFLGVNQVKILSSQGAVVKTLQGDGNLILWRGEGDSGSKLESGLYFAVAEGEGNQKTIPLVVVK